MTGVNAKQNQLIGEATDLKTGQPLYTEVHTFVETDADQQMVTSYLNVDSSEIASRTVKFRNDKVENYQLSLNNIDYKESVSRNQEGLEFRITDGGAEKIIQRVALDKPDEVVIDAGFNNFLLRNWDLLITGESLQFDFASTTQRDIVSLQVSLDKKRSTEERVVFSMNAANLFFRMLLKPIKVGFYRESRQLAYYRGVSNLKDEDGNAYKVEITFVDGQHPSSTDLARN